VRLIQEIGSYAGLAAIPGLAVLSALYFSQARDVKRLREWAGRAPERAEEQAMGGRAPVQQQRSPTVGAAQPVAAGQGGNGADAQQTGERTAAKPGALTPAAVASAAAGATKPPPGRTGAATGTIPRTAAAAAAAARPATAGGPPRRPVPVPGAAAAIRPASREPDPWYRRFADRLPAGRYVALIIAGRLGRGGGAAYGITQLASSDSGGKSSSAAKSSDLGPAPKKSSSKKDKGSSGTPAIDPSKVTITVVNGTSIPNLARDTASKLSGMGFQIGNKVTGTGSLAAAESVVEYKPGAEDEAKYVATKLHISQRQAADPDAVAQAGVATVIVVLGADQAPGG
jgi:LytR cell envelope-related transcriptional attenuator